MVFPASKSSCLIELEVLIQLALGLSLTFFEWLLGLSSTCLNFLLITMHPRHLFSFFPSLQCNSSVTIFGEEICWCPILCGHVLYIHSFEWFSSWNALRDSRIKWFFFPGSSRTSVEVLPSTHLTTRRSTWLTPNFLKPPMKASTQKMMFRGSSLRCMSVLCSVSHQADGFLSSQYTDIAKFWGHLCTVLAFSAHGVPHSLSRRRIAVQL